MPLMNISHTTDETESLLEISNPKITNSGNDITEISGASEENEYNKFKYNIPRSSACDDSKLTVELSKGPKGNNKKNFCVFCHTLQSKIARYLEN